MARTSFTVVREQKSAKEKIVGYLIGLFFVLYVSLLFGAAWQPNITINKWFDNFFRFVIGQHHYLVFAVTNGTPKAFVFCWMVWTLFYLVQITKIQHPFSGREHGDAKWGDAKEFTKEFGNHDSKNVVKIDFGDGKAPPSPVEVNTHIKLLKIRDLFLF